MHPQFLDSSTRKRAVAYPRPKSGRIPGNSRCQVVLGPLTRLRGPGFFRAYVALGAHSVRSQPECVSSKAQKHRTPKMHMRNHPDTLLQSEQSEYMTLRQSRYHYRRREAPMYTDSTRHVARMPQTCAYLYTCIHTYVCIHLHLCMFVIPEHIYTHTYIYVYTLSHACFNPGSRPCEGVAFEARRLPW